MGKMVISCISAMDEAEKTGEEIHPILLEISEFPHEINPDGSCSKLRDTICSIYDTRPDVCNIEAMYIKYWCKLMTIDEWYKMSHRSCSKLRGNRQ